MSNQEKTTNKESAKITPLPNSAKFIVMPQEFRKGPIKKPINKKVFIIGGGSIGVLIIVGVVIAIVLNQQPSQVVLEPAVPIVPVVAPETPTATSTEDTTTPQAPSLTEPTETPETPQISEPVEIVGMLVQGTDNDSDGLTEKEEAIFQTDSKRPDTDADGFLDGNEVFHLYNPSAVAPVGLIESGLAKLYRNASEGYSVYYPSLWATSSTTDTSMISFLSDETESINITTVEASSSITLRSWYISQFPDKDINMLQSYTSKEGYQGLQDSDRLNTYIKRGDKVFIINYDLGGIKTVWYRRLYDMILNSLKIE